MNLHIVHRNRRKVNETISLLKAKLEEIGITVNTWLSSPDGVHIDKPGGVALLWGCRPKVTGVGHFINKHSATALAANKTEFRRVLQGHDDIAVPMSWFEIPFSIQHMFPVIVRPAYHAAGKKFFYCLTMNQLKAAIIKCGPGYYISKYIPKDREFRVYVYAGYVMAVSEKIPGDKTDPAWNKSKDSTTSFKNVLWSNWPIEACKEALKAFAISGLDIGAVDVIRKDDQAYVIEINTSPTISGTYRVDVLARYLKYMLKSIDTYNEKPYNSKDVQQMKRTRDMRYAELQEM